jgi:hypothetical protein
VTKKSPDESGLLPPNQGTTGVAIRGVVLQCDFQDEARTVLALIDVTAPAAALAETC